MVLVLAISLLVSLVAGLPEGTPRCDSADHLPHTTDCRRYLTCVGGTPVEQRCPDGLEWNARDATCSSPDEAQCSPASSLDGVPALRITVPGKVVAAKCPPQQDRCPVEPNPAEEVIFLPHGDCRKFYACGPRGPIELSCPGRLYWNHESCRCDYGSSTGSSCGVDSSASADPSEAHIRVRREDTEEGTTTTEVPIQSGASVKAVASVLVLIATTVLNI